MKYKYIFIIVFTSFLGGQIYSMQFNDELAAFINEVMKASENNGNVHSNDTDGVDIELLDLDSLLELQNELYQKPKEEKYTNDGKEYCLAETYPKPGSMGSFCDYGKPYSVAFCIMDPKSPNVITVTIGGLTRVKFEHEYPITSYGRFGMISPFGINPSRGNELSAVISNTKEGSRITILNKSGLYISLDISKYAGFPHAIKFCMDKSGKYLNLVNSDYTVQISYNLKRIELVEARIEAINKKNFADFAEIIKVIFNIRANLLKKHNLIKD